MFDNYQCIVPTLEMIASQVYQIVSSETGSLQIRQNGSGDEQSTNASVKKVKAATCKECNITLNSEEQARSHYGGKSHQNRLKELGILTSSVPDIDQNDASKSTRCVACNLTLNSEAQAIQHYKGRPHLNRIKELELTGEGVTIVGVRAEAGRSRGVGFVHGIVGQLQTSETAFTSTVCTACGIMLNSVLQAKQHFEGKLHQMKCMNNGNITESTTIPVKVRRSLEYRGTTLPTVVYSQPQKTHPSIGLNSQHQQNIQLPQGLDSHSSLPGGQSAESAALKRKAVEVTCSVCCLVLNSETQAAHHFSSGRHVKRMKTQHESQKQWNSVLSGDTPEMTPRKKRFFCQQCQLSVNSLSQLNAHMQGQQHCSKLQMGQHPCAISTVGQPGELKGLPRNAWTELPGNKNGWFYCRICDISVPTAVALSQHILMDSHVKLKYQKSGINGTHDLVYNYSIWTQDEARNTVNNYNYPAYTQY